MSRKHLVEKSLLAFYDNDPGVLEIDAENLSQVRPELDKFVAGLNDPMRRDDVTVESLSISTPAGAVRVLLFKLDGKLQGAPRYMPLRAAFRGPHRTRA